nr:hypothetical protein [Roseobacter litoralis]
MLSITLFIQRLVQARHSPDRTPACHCPRHQRFKGSVPEADINKIKSYFEGVEKDCIPR